MLDQHNESPPVGERCVCDDPKKRLAVPGSGEAVCWACLAALADLDVEREPETAEEKKSFYGAVKEKLAQEPRLLPAPSEPWKVARLLAEEEFSDQAGTETLHRWRGQWWRWQASHWSESELEPMSGCVYRFTETAVYEKTNASGQTKPEPWAPTSHKVRDVLAALASLNHLGRDVDQPIWLTGAGPKVIIATSNGLLDVETRELLCHTPGYFNLVSVPFAYDPEAPQPKRWLRFLSELWPEDEDQRRVLQQWAGYVLSGRTDLHKILLMVGPTRAGKGIICGVLSELVGVGNTAGPTLGSLCGEFGLAPLIGKSLAVVSDARLSGRNANTVVERLLSISGEDPLVINIKYRQQWNGKLPVRFMICSNELPRLSDASGAIAGRFIPLVLTQSWFGREDLRLAEDLRPSYQAS